MNTGIIEKILELARWAPSGDNTQVWRFEIIGPDHLLVHCFDTRDDCVYDLDGHPSQISYGALLETIAIAATAYGLRTEVVRLDTGTASEVKFDVVFIEDASVEPSPLLGSITARTVQRRPMSTRPLTEQQKHALEAAVGRAYHVTWFEGIGPRLRMARLMFDNAKLRLTMPEAYEVHRRIIDWDANRSPDKVPDQALGVDAATLRLMKWAMVSWRRLSTMNAVMGTWAPRLQMDLIPGLACAAHFVIKAKQEPKTIDDFVDVGRAVQRFWLTLTQLGMFMQPEMTPLIFSTYVREGRSFTRLPQLHERAKRLEKQTAALIRTDEMAPAYMGRLGFGPAPVARSERLPLAALMKK